MESIEFIYPQFFLMFALPLVWLTYTLITKKRVEQTIFSPDILKKLTSSSGGFSIKTQITIALFSLLFMIIALARPVIKEGSVEVESRSVDVLFALDISKSMLASDRYPNRLEFAKKKSIDIIKGLTGNRVGVVAFANSGYTVAPLTFDRSGVEYLVKNIDSQNISEQGTSIERLLYSVNTFLKDNPDRVLILFTDGGDSLNYSDEIALAKEMNLKIFVVGVASDSGAPIKLKDGTLLKDKSNSIVITKFNDAIKELALQTGGIFMNGVNSEDDVKAILQEIERIDSTEVKKDELPIYVELFIYPLLISLILLFPTLYSLPKMPKLKKIWLIPLSLLYFGNQNLEAGLLDWWYIDKADESLSSGDYGGVVENLSKVESSDEVKFNIANSYYQSGDYDKAIENYQSIKGDLKREALYNIGNSYVQKNDLEKAKDSYEKSLEIEENPKARENLEWVRNRLQKDQEQKNDQQNQENREDRDQKEDKNSKDQNQKDQQNKNGDNQKENQKDQEQKNDQQNQENREDRDQKEDKNSKDQNQKDQQNKNGDNQKENQNEDREKDQKNDKEAQKRDKKSEEQQQKENQSSEESKRDDKVEQKESDQESRDSSQKSQKQNQKMESDKNSTKDDRVMKMSENNLTEERDFNMSQISMPSDKELKERMNMEEMKILNMLNRLKGGTKVYSIPVTDMPERRDDVKPW